MRERFTAAVEEITGRQVIGFLSQVHFDPDISLEAFVLAPSPAADVSGDGASAGAAPA